MYAPNFSSSLNSVRPDSKAVKLLVASGPVAWKATLISSTFSFEKMKTSVSLSG